MGIRLLKTAFPFSGPLVRKYIYKPILIVTPLLKSGVTIKIDSYIYVVK
jgi:hypothetical protein